MTGRPRWGAIAAGLLGIAAPLLLDGLGLLPAGLTPAGARVLGCAWLMAWWWIGSGLPPAIPSLAPLALFPALGISTAKEVSPRYADAIVILLLCGFLAASAVERWNLHRRLSLVALLRFGGSPQRLLLTVMGITAALSMWISNTATTLMMVPIVVALGDAAARANPDAEANRRFSGALVLAVAWAASIGGIATPIGTPPNLILRRAIAASSGGDGPGFLPWMLVAGPGALALLGIAAWLLLRGRLAVAPDHRLGAPDALRVELAELGPWSRPERVVAVGFAAMALLWVFRLQLGIPKAVDDSTIAAGVALAFFLLPSFAGPDGPPTLLSWSYAEERVPWGLLLLFGGGLALADGFEAAGVTAWLGQQLGFLASLPRVVLVAGICLAVTFLTEVTSNTATTSLLLPVLAGVAQATDLPPMWLMLPATLAASCAFMLPVATAPNAIVVGSGRLDPDDMARLGLRLNLIGVVPLTVVTLLGADALG